MHGGLNASANMELFGRILCKKDPEHPIALNWLDNDGAGISVSVSHPGGIPQSAVHQHCPGRRFIRRGRAGTETVQQIDAFVIVYLVPVT